MTSDDLKITAAKDTREARDVLVSANARENHPTREKATRGVAPFLAWGDFHARSSSPRSTIPEGKWGTTRGLLSSGVAKAP